MKYSIYRDIILLNVAIIQKNRHTYRLYVDFKEEKMLRKSFKWLLASAFSALIIASAPAVVDAEEIDVNTEVVSTEDDVQTDSIEDDGFVIDSNGVLTKYTGTATEVTIPSTVTAIGNDAFRDKKNIVKITIPSSVTSIGANAFQGVGFGTETSLGSVTIPGSVKYMGHDAFNSCEWLGEVTFEDAIGDGGIRYSESWGQGHTFINCTHLKKIHLSTNVVHLPSGFASGCKSLQTVDWPESLQLIESEAFNDCNALQSIDLSKTKVETIEGRAFTNCTSAENVVFPETLKAIGDNAFDHCSIGTPTKTSSLVIPKNVANIGHAAFSNCKYLDKVTFMDSESPLKDGINFGKSYGNGNTFSNCDKLNSIIFSNNIKELAKGFASNCDVLEEVTWSETQTCIDACSFENAVCLKSINLSKTNVTEIGGSAFSNCKVATDIQFPKTLSFIGDNAFQGCAFGTDSKLGTLIIPEKVHEIWNGAFKNCTYLGYVKFEDAANPLIDGITYRTSWGQGDYFANCKNLKSIYLSNNNVYIPEGFASDCTSLQIVTWPATAKGIDSSAFSGCKSLKKANLTKTNITYIGSSAFSGCSSIGVVIFPKTITSIGGNAFSGCKIGTDKAVGNIVIPKSVTEIGNDAFSDCTDLGYVYFEDAESPLLDGISFKLSWGNNRSFAGCKKLRGIRLSNNVQWVGAGMFRDCEALTDIMLSSSVKTIEKGSFYVNLGGDKKLATNVGGNDSFVKSYDWNNDNRTLTGKAPKEIPSTVTDNIPDTVTDDPNAPQDPSTPDTPGTEEGIDASSFGDITLPFEEITLGLTKAKKDVKGNNTITVVPMLSSLNVNNKIKWTVDDAGKKVVSVANGKITAKKPGTAVVTAQIKNGKYSGNKAEIKITVVDDPKITLPATSISTNSVESYDVNVKAKGMANAKISPNKGIMLPIIASTTAKANKIKWTVSDKSLASVSSTGKVIGKQPGTVTVTATLDGVSVSYKVKIYSAAIDVTQKTFKMAVGSSQDLSEQITSITGSNTNKSSVIWMLNSKKQSAIVSLSPSGTVTANKKGTANVLAMINGVMVKFTVKIQ